MGFSYNSNLTEANKEMISVYVLLGYDVFGNMFFN